MTTKATVHFPDETEFPPLRVFGSAQSESLHKPGVSIQATFTPSSLADISYELHVVTKGDDEVNAMGHIIKTARDLGGTVESLEYVSP